MSFCTEVLGLVNRQGRVLIHFQSNPNHTCSNMFSPASNPRDDASDHGGHAPVADQHMFSPASLSAASTGGIAESQATTNPQSGRNLVQRKVDRAAKAREAKLKIRQQARQTGSVAAHAQAQWPSETRESAARQLLWQPTLTSLRALSRALHVDRRLLSRMTVISASLLLAEQENAFNTLLSDVRTGVEEKWLQPRLFAWGRMYDETPARAWTHIIKPAGELEGHAAVAKVMASLLSFSMVLDVSGELDDSQLSSCDCLEAGASGM
jgi:hypothetical protein